MTLTLVLNMDRRGVPLTVHDPKARDIAAFVAERFPRMCHHASGGGITLCEAFQLRSLEEIVEMGPDLDPNNPHSSHVVPRYPVLLLQMNSS